MRLIFAIWIEIYQFMNDDFPAEWFPISNTTIFFLGASNLSANWLAICMRPEIGKKISFSTVDTEEYQL